MQAHVAYLGKIAFKSRCFCGRYRKHLRKTVSSNSGMIIYYPVKYIQKKKKVIG